MSSGRVEETCREWLDAEHDRCGERAEFILWGKYFPSEAFGPRCYDHAAKHLGDMSAHSIEQTAVYDLRRVYQLKTELAVVEHTSQANANAHMTTHAELTRLRKNYRTLWDMTFGHDGQPPVGGTPDDVEQLRARFTDLNGDTQ